MAVTEQTVLGLSSSGFHRIAYTQWGEPENPRVLICVHGLTRNARDFDFLAQALAPYYRVLCPDIAGRGRSDWLSNKADYNYPQYLQDMVALIARSGATQVDWVGTSMGGLIGMLLAAQQNTPIRRLVINDVGPFIPRAALERIAAYVGQSPHFASLAEMETYIRRIAAPFGPLSDAQWHHLTEYGARQTEHGDYVFRYDPGIAEPFQALTNTDVDLWSYWDQVQCPTLLLRGQESDILRAEDAQAMTQRGPKPELIEFAGIGHAPTLLDETQIKPVRDWLLQNS